MGTTQDTSAASMSPAETPYCRKKKKKCEIADHRGGLRILTTRKLVEVVARSCIPVLVLAFLVLL